MNTEKVLSKTRFMAGLQCPLQLWLRVNEKNAPELQIDDVSRARMETGNRVGEIARGDFPGGALIQGKRYEYEKKRALTEQAISAGAPIIYEAAFVHEGTFVSVDILEREPNGWVIREVKSSTRVKDEHLPDVAIQFMTARAAGLNVSRAEVVYLNRECRYPDLSNLFMVEDVTLRVEALIEDLRPREDELKLVMVQDPPEAQIGYRCDSPRACPFKGRCWPELPEHHVSTLYRLGKEKIQVLMEEGVHTVDQISGNFKLSATAARQVDSVRSGKLVVEAGLASGLDSLTLPAAFLDFETISMAIPIWEQCGPYTQVPVQFSCHTMDTGGELIHTEWLAEAGADPRHLLAQSLVDACDGVETVVAYNSSFEKACIVGLAKVCPALEDELMAIASKLVDLLPIVRNNVYHPQFHGSFSIKSVLPALIPSMGYANLEVASGDVAALKLEKMILGEIAGNTHELRSALLKYCEMDTYAMVELYRKLKGLAGQKAAECA
jgi:predicted RecB family nuclease